MTRTIAVGYLLAGVLAGAWPARAAAQGATVDQVLAAVAEVVRDRAKAVASRTIARRVEGSLCSGTIELKPLDPPRLGGEPAPAARSPTANQPTVNPEAATRGAGRATREPTAARPLTLHLGGGEACVAAYLKGEGDWQAACGHDDVFVRTCRAARRLEVPLTDAYFLTSLSRDTVDFLLRLAARDLSADGFRDAGLNEVGAFVHAVLEQLGRERPRPGDLADPTLALAARLSAGLPRRTLEQLDPAVIRPLAAAAERVAGAWVAGGCEYAGATRGKACGRAELRADEVWFLKAGDAPGEAACDAFARASPRRALVFEEVLGAGGALAAGRDRPCGEAYPAGEARVSCSRARLALNLHDALVKLRCAKRADGDALRPVFRELGYVFAEQHVYRDAFPAAGEDGGAAALDGFVEAVHALDFSDLPREQLAYGVRILGAYAAAAELAPEDTGRWIRGLADEVGRVQGPAGYAALLHGQALGSGTRPADPALLALRDAVKDFVTLPSLAIRSGLDATRGVRSASAEALRALRRLLEPLRRNPAAAGDLRDYLGALSGFVAVLGDVVDAASAESRLARVAADRVRALAAEAAARVAAREGGEAAARAVAEAEEAALSPEQLQARFSRAALALKQGALALELASRRDWVGLAIRVSDELARGETAGKVVEVGRALRFVRVLLSMYQAASVEEAKAIFAANLEDEASRERRWPGGATVDVAALVGLRFGGETARVGGDLRDPVMLYGLYAPFGVQLAKGRAGAMVYPFDLGSYLVATKETAGAGPRWHDALRIGAAGYLRPWAEVPVDLIAGTDFRPAFERRAEWRYFLSVGLELPLFVIH